MFLRLSSTYKSFCLVSLFSLAMQSDFLYSETPRFGNATQETAYFDGLAGIFPVKIRLIIDQLKKSGVDLKSGKKSPKTSIQNRLLLYGPTGNGKTTIAKKIAERAGAHCIYKCPFGLTSGTEEEIAANIRETFFIAHEYVDKNSKPVVIIFDDIDDEKTELLGASQELRHQLSLIQDDARFLFISISHQGATNPSFKANFGGNIEKIDAPNEGVRREVLQYYKKNFTGTPWNEQILKKLVANSGNEKISIRFLEDYVREVYMVAENDNDGVITDKLAWDIFEEMKSKYVESFSKKVKRQISSVFTSR